MLLSPRFGIGMVLALLPALALCQTLTKLNDISFGKVEYAAPLLKGQILMGTDGNITYGTNTSGNGFGVAARVQVGGTVGTTISIRCRATSRVTNTSGATFITISPVKVSKVTPQAYASAANCAGLTTTTLTHVLSSTAANNIIYLAGRLQTNNKTVANGIFKATNPTGVLGTLRVVYQ